MPRTRHAHEEPYPTSLASRVYIGIDNGPSGSVGIIADGQSDLWPVPTKKEQDYTKKKKNVSRMDMPLFTTKLRRYLNTTLIQNYVQHVRIMLERPMVFPGRFVATTSALRFLEATMIAIEWLQVPYIFIDSKQWQKQLLPHGTSGPELKTASAQIGKRMFPHLSPIIDKIGDADGILIAEHCRRFFRENPTVPVLQRPGKDMV